MVKGGCGFQISRQSAHVGGKFVPQDQSAAERIMLMKISIDTIGNRTRELPAFSAVPQPTVPPRALFYIRITAT
jgi:hypothetical protein